jgi:hypothetical protein
MVQQFVHLDRIGAEYYVRRQHRLTGSCVDAHGDRELDAGVIAEHGVDLAQFDAESAYFHLVIRASDVFDRLERRPPNQVTGPVHAGAGRAERRCHESRRRQRGLVEVAAGKSEAGDVELTGDPDGYRLSRAVENYRGHAPDGSTDGHGLPHRQGIADAHHDRGFRRPVTVEQPATRCPLADQFG